MPEWMDAKVGDRGLKQSEDHEPQAAWLAYLILSRQLPFGTANRQSFSWVIEHRIHCQKRQMSSSLAQALQEHQQLDS